MKKKTNIFIRYYYIYYCSRSDPRLAAAVFVVVSVVTTVVVVRGLLRRRRRRCSLSLLLHTIKKNGKYVRVYTCIHTYTRRIFIYTRGRNAGAPAAAFFRKPANFFSVVRWLPSTYHTHRTRHSPPAV